ncbi:hypothetical protein M513_09824 [Trichuris suis]|uniref:Zinc knuckle n=1 Tax=Trichuris suis TaxID=68888 RepID=A0A085LWC6_9BILA|nr:hypothetical protein M513_09824 [Trichuris suis]
MEARTTERVFDRRLIPEFDGSSQSVAEWLEKLELVCKLCKVVVAAQVIPLRLTGRALPFTSNCPSRTGKSRWSIRKHAGERLCHWLSEHAQNLLRAGARVEDLSLYQLLTRARVILAGEFHDCERDAGLGATAQDAYRNGVSQNATVRCHGSCGVNHVARECPTKRPHAGTAQWARGRIA